MSRLGFTKSVVYHGEVMLGELDVIPVKDTNFLFPNNEIRIHHINSPSERCSPLSVLQTISSFSVRCKLQSSSPLEQTNLINLHASCFHENKTAVLLIGNEEIHLVAMPSKEKKFPCFWCFAIPLGLYNSCLAMLNMRCLAIVFDLDETLIVANTMKSFEDRIELIRGWIARETDPMRISGMTAEMKRYIEDRLLLKQYAESDVVADNGKIYKVQLEEVPLSSDTHDKRIRPVIRLQEKNIVLTRINPEIRDTSVLVRLRPAWEELRSYLTAKGRKRFEVYVCTMAERDYALEMWRLLDPELHLISSKQLSDRVVCVKSGSRKSLLNVFQDGVCHPKMAMVIDDRFKVWEDRDQPRVHVVPPFTPYYAPQAETANAVPVLCVARNVACNVRACFFKEFDEVLIRKICEISYEDDVISLPPTPDVSNYLMSEDTGFVSNGNGNCPIGEGMSGAEVEQRLHQSSENNVMDTALNSIANSMEVKPEILQPSIIVNPSIAGAAPSILMSAQRPSLLGNPVRRDLRNSGQPPILSRVPVPVSSSSAQPQGGWLVEEDSSRPGIGNRSTMGPQDADPLKSDKLQVLQNPFGHSTLAAPPPVTQTSQVKREEAFSGRDIQKQGLAPANHTLEVGVSQNSVSSNNKGFHSEAGKMNLPPSHLSIGVLQEIGRRCSAKVEFRSVVSTSKDLQFSVEVLFTGEKIGVGMGKTRKDAQQQAAENALRSLAEKYVAYIAPRSGVDQENCKVCVGNENGFLWDIASPGSSEAIREDGLPRECSPEATEVKISTSNQHMQKCASSPRLRQSFPSKRTKEEP